MNSKVRWGILGTANIAVKKVIPAMQQGQWSEVTAIASRDFVRAEQIGRDLRIPKVYGSYEALLADDEIEAVYIPLPNDLHVPWSIRAAQAGKHVLCEKPIGLDLKQAKELLSVRDQTGVHIQEAFMVRNHPQWLAARELVLSGRIGELRSITGFFSYFNRDENNIRNNPEMGGGALMDIGCYPINISRWLFGQEPTRVVGTIDRDPDMGVDRLTTAILDFPSGQAAFTCSTQLVPYQRMQLFGTLGRIEVPIPFNAPPDRPTAILIDDGSDLFGRNIEEKQFPVCDQYTIQSDLFSRAIREGTPTPVPLEDALNNMAVIDAVFRSADSGNWVSPVKIS